mgnify:CR=1 FL=1
MHITYRPKGVCSQKMDIDVEDGIIEKVEILGGCSGNLQGISRLVKENCDYLVSLPMKGQVNSLNASVATGIFIYNIINSRNN